MDIVLTLRELVAYGSAVLAGGGLIATVTVNKHSIKRLWDLKQDKGTCIATHEPLNVTLKEIKQDIRWFREQKENGD